MSRPESARRLDVQGLRAIAVLCVVAFHADVGLTGGFVGVDVFFAISGFVITTTLVAELERTGRLSLPGFYLRRVKRLLPALAAVITFVAVAGTLATPSAATHISGMTGFFASFFAANVYLDSLPTGYFSVSTQLDPLLHTWTLAVEEQFYLVFPVLLWAAWLLGSRRAGLGRTLALVVLGTTGLASLLLAELAAGPVGSGIGYYGSPTRAWEFAAGCLIALSVSRWRRLSGNTAVALAAAGISGIAFTAFSTAANAWLSLPAIIPVASTCALIVAGCQPNGITRLLSTRALSWVGDLSYSLYLWHWPLIVFALALFPASAAAAPAAAAVSFIPAWLSYRFIENPVRRNPLLRGRRAVALAAACIAIPALISLGGSRIPELGTAAYAAANHADFVRGCDSYALFGSPARRNCTWHVDNARGSVVLIGDSNAGQFTEAFVAAANRAGYSATVAAPSGCPFVQLRIEMPAESQECIRFNRDALRALVALEPSLVVISTRSDRYLRGPQFSLGERDGAMTNDPRRKQRLWAADLAAEVDTLNRAGIPIVLLRPVPSLPSGGHRDTCAVLLLLTNRCGATISRASADRRLAVTQEIEDAAVRGHRGWIVSFENQLCSHNRCSSSRNGVVLYRNSDHLSVAGARTLTSSFEREVIPHARGW